MKCFLLYKYDPEVKCCNYEFSAGKNQTAVQTALLRPIRALCQTWSSLSWLLRKVDNFIFLLFFSTNKKYPVTQGVSISIEHWAGVFLPLAFVS